MVFVGGIQIHVIAFVSEVFALKGESSRPVVIINCGFFPRGTPLRFHGLGEYAKISDWPVAVAWRLQGTSANKREFGVVKDFGTEIADHDSGRSRSHEPIEGLLEERGRRGKA